MRRERTRLAEETGRDHDQPGLDRGERGIVEAPLAHRFRRERLDHDVGPAHEVEHDLARGGVAEIEREAALAGVDRPEPGRRLRAGHAAVKRRQEAHQVGTLHRLDLDHRRAVVGEHARGPGAGHDPGEVEDLDVRQRSGRAAAPPPTPDVGAQLACPYAGRPPTPLRCAPRPAALAARATIGVPLEPRERARMPQRLAGSIDALVLEPEGTRARTARFRARRAWSRPAPSAASAPASPRAAPPSFWRKKRRDAIEQRHQIVRRSRARDHRAHVVGPLARARSRDRALLPRPSSRGSGRRTKPTVRRSRA